MDDRGREGELRFHPLRQGGDRLVGFRDQVQYSEELPCADRKAFLGQVADAADVAEELARGQVFRERRRLGHVANVGFVTDRVCEHVVVLHTDDAIVGPQQADQDLQGRRFARAVGSDQADDLAGVGVQEESLEGWLPFVRFPELLHVDCERHEIVGESRPRHLKGWMEGRGHTRFLPSSVRRRSAFAFIPSRS